MPAVVVQIFLFLRTSTTWASLQKKFEARKNDRMDMIIMNIPELPRTAAVVVLSTHQRSIYCIYNISYVFFTGITEFSAGKIQEYSQHNYATPAVQRASGSLNHVAAVVFNARSNALTMKSSHTYVRVTAVLFTLIFICTHTHTQQTTQTMDFWW